MPRHSFTSLVLILAVGISCRSAEDSASVASSRAALMSDQVHNDGTRGFLFLAPMVAQPNLEGTFEPGLPAVVQIDQIDPAAGSVLRTVATFTTTTGPGSETVRVDEASPCYVANWHTDAFVLNASETYRIRVLVPGGRELGFVDVDVVNKGSELRNVNTNEYIALLDGRTVPIKFWIGQGVVDRDSDSVFDYADNCPDVANQDQLDSDQDGTGNACECVGVVCTAADQCHLAGICDPTDGTCSNPAAADGTSCSDGNACTQSDSCQVGVCTGADPVTCTAQDQCHVAGVCDPANGTCSNPAVADGTSCNDGNTCTQLDTCQVGACIGASPVLCTARDQCHAPGSCDPASGTCSNPAVPDGLACNDGNACTQKDTCQSGVCTGANPIVCKVIDQCHLVGTCDPMTGTCSNPPDLDNPPKVVATILVGGHPGVVALNPNTKRLYVGQDPANSVAVVDILNNRLVRTIRTAGYQNVGIAANPNTGRVFVTQGFAKQVLVFDGSSTVNVPVPSSDTIAGIAVNPQTNKIYVASNLPGGLFVMDGAANSCGPFIDLNAPMSGLTSAGMAIDSTDSTMYLADRPRNRVVMLDTDSNQILGATSVGVGPLGVAVNSTTHRAYVANIDGDTISIVDTDTKEVIRTIVGGRGPSGVAINPITNRIYVSNYFHGTGGDSVSVVDGNTDTIVGTIPVGTNPFGVAIDPTNGVAYVANNTDGTISVVRDCSCVARTCAQLGANCGSISDACGSTLDCGTCSAPETCGGSGTANVCGVSQSTFAATGSMASPRGFNQQFTLTMLNDGRVLAAGGANGPTWLASAELYDPSTGTWSMTSSMSSPRLAHDATLLADGRVLVAGGLVQGSADNRSAELFDPVTGAWSSTGMMTESRYLEGEQSLLLPNGHILIAGGADPQGGWLATAELYDPVSGTFSPTGPLTHGRRTPHLALLPNGKVLIAGGGSTAACELYDPASGTWSLTGSMQVSRYDGFKLVPLADGRILMAGGSQAGTGAFTAITEVYDSDTGTWTRAADLPEPRGGDYAATRLADGRVLVAGGIVVAGSPPSNHSNTAVLFDVTSNAWTPATGLMTTARAGVRSAMLRDGRVLLVGGTTRELVHPASAELFIP